jgi:hypothetical protein
MIIKIKEDLCIWIYIYATCETRPKFVYSDFDTFDIFLHEIKFCQSISAQARERESPAFIIGIDILDMIYQHTLIY